ARSGVKAQVIVEFLELNPDIKAFLAAGAPANSRDITVAEYKLARAATWPDHVRPPERDDTAEHARLAKLYHQPDWHYINLAFVNPRDAGQVSPFTPKT